MTVLIVGSFRCSWYIIGVFILRFLALTIAGATICSGGVSAVAMTGTHSGPKGSAPAPSTATQSALIAATTAARQAYAAHDLATAERKYQEAIQLAKLAEPKVRIVLLSNLGAVYRDDHKYDLAETAFKDALQTAQVSGLEQDPASKVMMQHYARLLRKMDKNMEADALEVRAAGQAPSQPAGLTYASNAVRRAPSAVPKLDLPSGTAAKLGFEGDIETMSTEDLAKQVAKHPEEEILWARLGMKYFEEEKWPDAAGSFKRWLDITKTRQEKARYCYAVALIRAGQPEQALEHCKKLVAEKPEEADYYRVLSNCYSMLGDVSAQLAVDEQFVEKFPTHSEYGVVSSTIPYLKRDVEQGKTSAQNAGNKPTNDELQSSWIKAAMPLKVFIKERDDDSITLEPDPSGSITENTPGALLSRAMDEWSQASQGRISFVLADRLEDANVTCEFTEAPDGLENEWMAGVTSWSASNPARPQANVRLLIVNRKTGKRIDRGRFYETALHEFGHALGLAHSNSVDDIMYRKARPQTMTQLSDNDRDRLVKLYTAL